MSEDSYSDDHKKLFATRESLEHGAHFFVRIRIQPGRGLTHQEAAARILLVTTQRTMRRASFENRDRRLEHAGRITAIDTTGNIELAIPQSFCTHREGLTHLMTLLGTAAEYSYADRFWVESLELPKGFVDECHGPRVGVVGIRKEFNVFNRPLLGVTIKPRIGESANTIAEAVREAVRGGCDFFVDDLLLVDPPGELSFERRLARFTQISRDLTQELKRPCKYFMNIGTGIARAHKWVSAAIQDGVGGVLINCFTMGIGAVEVVAQTANGRAPIICTNMGSGLMSRGTFATQSGSFADGLSEGVLAKLSRLAGADAVHTGTSASECFGQDAWGPATRALHDKMYQISPSMAVAEGDITVANLWHNISSLGSDMLVEAATGIYNAPGGPAAGAAAFLSLLNHLKPEMSRSNADAVVQDLASHDKLLRKVLEEFEWKPQ